MRISPRRINALLKQRFREAGMSYEGPRLVNPSQSSLRPYRKVPVERLVYKIDVVGYMGIHPEYSETRPPATVRIPLQQHIGAPAMAQVKVGDEVRPGDPGRRNFRRPLDNHPRSLTDGRYPSRWHD